MIFNKISKTKALGIFFLLVLIEFESHDFLDLQTSFGTMLLYPFSDRRFSLDLIFIVDFYYTTILLVGIILTYIWKGKGELISRTAIVLIIIYTGFCAYNHSKALNLARNFASNNKIEAINISSLPLGTLEDRYPFLYKVDFDGNGNPVFQGFREGGMLKLEKEK